MFGSRYKFLRYAALGLAIVLLGANVAKADTFSMTAAVPAKQRSASVTVSHTSDAGWWHLWILAVDKVLSLKVTLRDAGGNVVAENSKLLPRVGFAGFIFSLTTTCPQYSGNCPLPAGTYSVTLLITATGMRGASATVSIDHCDEKTDPPGELGSCQFA